MTSRTTSRVLAIAAATLCAVSLAPTTPAAQIYVDIRNDSGTEDGTLASPYNTIQEGIDAGVGGDEVIVADGVYPETIIMDDGVDVLGAGADRTVIDATGLDNSAVTFDFVRDNAILSGFTITGGNGDLIGFFNDDPIIGGGGIKIIHSDPVIENVVITGNTIDEGIAVGAGIYVLVQANTATIRDSYIHGNTAVSTTIADAGSGGGLYLETKSGGVVLSGNRIENNAAVEGGGVYVQNTAGSTTLIERNKIRNNTAKIGGGIRLEDVDGSTTTVVNNLIRGNGTTATGGLGGGIWAKALGVASFVISNNTLVDNFVTAGNGGAMLLDDLLTSLPDSLAANNIVAGNSAVSGGGIDHTAFTGTIRNSDFHNNTGGDLFDGGGSTATLTANLFVDPGFMGADDFRLSPTSVLIDGADEPSAPLDDREGFARPFDGDGDMSPVSDIGAYEYPSGEVSGLIFVDATSLSWDILALQDTFNLYRGRLTRLIFLGEYTQDPLAEPMADQFCGIVPGQVPYSDVFVPAAGEPLFYLVTLANAGWESELGLNQAGLVRANANPCP